MRYLWLILLLIPGLLFSDDIIPLQFNLITTAYNNMLTGNYELAEKQYQQAAILYPQESSAWEGLLWSLNAQGKFRKTLKTFSDAKTKLPEPEKLYNYYAYALSMQNRFPEARFYYKQALENMPVNPLANEVSCEGLAYVILLWIIFMKHKQFFRALFICLRPYLLFETSFNSTVYYKFQGKQKLLWLCNLAHIKSAKLKA
jgi:tetratricopeptide (TPR) repeat protein